MNRVINFYNYDQCFAFYTKRIMNIRQAKIHGEVIMAKPVLLLAIIDGIDAQVFCKNEFTINEWLENRYYTLMSKYVSKSQFKDITGLEKPFWHLETDGFWHIMYPGLILPKSSTPSLRWIKDNISFAYFDDELWLLLQNQEWRIKLRDYIVENKLTHDDKRLEKIISDGLGIFAFLLLSA